MKNLLTILVIATILATFLCVPVFATGYDDNLTILPMMSYINEAKVSIRISSDNTAYVSTRVDGYSCTTKLHATMTLQKQNSNGTWSNVKTWTSSSNSNRLNMNRTYNVTSENTYRVRSTVTAYGSDDGKESYSLISGTATSN